MVRRLWNADEYEDEMETLAQMFPRRRREALGVVLLAHGGNVRRAVEYILSDPEGAFEVDDVILNGVEDFVEYSSTPRRPRRFEFDVSQTAASIEEMKHVVIPELRAQLTGMEIPDVVSSSIGGRVEFGIKGIRCVSLCLSPENVHVEMEREVMVITARNVSLQLSVEQWTYERISTPRLRDSGAALASLGNIMVQLSLVPGERGTGRPLIELRHVTTRIPNVKVRISDSRASWLYNAAAAVLRPAMRNAAERALQDGIERALEDQINTRAQTGG